MAPIRVHRHEVRRVARAETTIDDATKRRLRVLANRERRSEADIVNRALLDLLDREHVSDPGEEASAATAA